MKYLLDTNICIHFLNGTSLSVTEKLRSLSPGDIFLCSIVKAELYYGAEKSGKRIENIYRLERFFIPFTSLLFNDESAKQYGKIRNLLSASGKVIGPYDMQIASIALVHGLILVTHNLKEFRRIKSLKIEDWVE